MTRPSEGAACADCDCAWRPIETAPWQTVIEVRNRQMREDEFVLAVRGYCHNGMVHPNTTFCTTIYTPNPDGFPFPAGKLCCPTEWRPHAAETSND